MQTEVHHKPSIPFSLRVDFISAFLASMAASCLSLQAAQTGTRNAQTPSVPPTWRTNWSAVRLNTGAQSSAQRPATTATLAEVGPHHRTWSIGPVDGDGPDAPASDWQGRRGRRIVEIASGMNYWTGQEWAPSDPSFTLTPEGDAFVAERVQHRTRLAGQLNMVGAVTVSMPDGTVLRSTPVAIGLFDATSGRSAILAGLGDCAGVLVNSNQVVYAGAFNENGVSADVVYTLENGWFAQDVIITGRLDPADYGFPTNAVRLQIYSEFYPVPPPDGVRQPARVEEDRRHGFPTNAVQVQIARDLSDVPQPERVRQPVRVEEDRRLRERMVSPDLLDELLGWGEFVIATGRAVPAGTARWSGDAAAPVVKEFVQREGRAFLLESVEVASIESELKALPDRRTAAVERRRAAEPAQYAAIPRPPRAPAREGKSFASSPRDLQLAAQAQPDRQATSSGYKPAGLAIDYLATIGGNITNTQVFQGDTTYFVSGEVYCSGAVHIEGGAIFKYPYSLGGSNPKTAFIRLANTVISKTSSYRPAIFTAGDDQSLGDSVAEVWPYWNGDTTGKSYANPALWTYNIGAPALTHLRFCYANEALRMEGGSTASGTLSHSQFVNCVKAITITGSGGSTGSGIGLTVNNSLFAKVRFPLTANARSYGNLYHCTVDGTTNGSGNLNTRLLTSTASAATFTFVNSVLASVATNYSGTASLSGSYNGFYPETTARFGSTQVVVDQATGSPFESTTIFDPEWGEFPNPVNMQGYYYLWPGCAFREVGTLSVPTALKNELARLTTTLPHYIEGEVFDDLVLTPVVAGDTDALDLGYHYPRIDYVLYNVALFNSTLWAKGGVVVAFTFVDGSGPAGYGLRLGPGAKVVSCGRPEELNVFTRLNQVQEHHVVEVAGRLMPMLTSSPVLTSTPSTDLTYAAIDLRFTDLVSIAGPNVVYGPPYSLYDAINRNLFGLPPVDWRAACYFASIRLQDCQVRGGIIELETGADVPRSLVARNTLFERCLVETLDSPNQEPGNPFVENWLRGPEVAETLEFYNCLFFGGRVWLEPMPVNSWIVRDTVFDKVELQPNSNPIAHHDHNAYVQMNGLRLQPAPGAGDVVLTSALAYGSTALGRYYLPANSTALINHGSRSAGAAGLFHYTTQLDQTKEATSTVEIGLHYVAYGSGSGGGGGSEVPKGGMSASGSSVYAYGPWGYANAINGAIADPGWHNNTYTGQAEFLRLDLGTSRPVCAVGYTPRQCNPPPGGLYDGSRNGVYRDFEIYVTDVYSDNPANWGSPATSGQWTFPSGQERRDVSFAPRTGRYVYFRRVNAWGWYGPEDPAWAAYGYPPGFASAGEVWVYEQAGGGGGASLALADSDGDGVPDYLEDRNGDGSVQPDESSPTTPTAPSELRLLGVSTGQVLSGMKQLHVLAGSLDTLNSVVLHANGQPIFTMAAESPVDNPSLSLELDTRTLPNGPCVLTIVASYRNTPGAYPLEVETVSSPVDVTIDNPISLAEWREGYPAYDANGNPDGIWFRAHAVPGSTCTVNFYSSPETSIFSPGGDWVGSVSGQADPATGVVELHWLGEAGTPVLLCQIQSTGGSQSGTSKAQALKLQPQEDWPDSLAMAMWAVALEDDFRLLPNQDIVANMMDTIGNAGEQAGDLLPQPSAGKHYFNIRNGQDIPKEDKDADWAQLRDALAHPDVRNFYYFGHGIANNYLGGRRAISLRDLKAKRARRYFRFVFVDGCNTMKSSLPSALIQARQIAPYDTLDDRIRFNERPSAVVGWTRYVYVVDTHGNPYLEDPDGLFTTGEIYQKFIYYRTEFIRHWTGFLGTAPELEVPLKTSLDRAYATYLALIGTAGEQEAAYPYGDGLAISGFLNLRWKCFNGADWKADLANCSN